jgi:glutaredoxin
MKIRVYGKEVGCGKCDVIKKKLDSKNLEYEYITDIDLVTKALTAKGTMFTPVVEIDETLYNFTEANAFINSL